MVIEGDLPRQPARLGVRPDEDEDPARLQSGRLTGLAVANLDRLHRIVAVRGRGLGPGEHLDVRPGGELV